MTQPPTPPADLPGLGKLSLSEKPRGRLERKNFYRTRENHGVIALYTQRAFENH